MYIGIYIYEYILISIYAHRYIVISLYTDTYDSEYEQYESGKVALVINYGKK